MKKKKISKTGKVNSAETKKRLVLEKELKSLIKRADEEGLIFLIRQAQTIVHNLQVDRLNKALIEADSPASSKKQGMRRTTANKEKSVVDVEETANGLHFVVVVNARRKMFSRDEFRKIVGLAHAGKNNADGGGKIYLWLKNNRQDVLLDAGIASNQHPSLMKLSQLLKSRYKVKK